MKVRLFGSQVVNQTANSPGGELVGGRRQPAVSFDLADEFGALSHIAAAASA